MLSIWTSLKFCRVIELSNYECICQSLAEPNLSVYMAYHNTLLSGGKKKLQQLKSLPDNNILCTYLPIILKNILSLVLKSFLYKGSYLDGVRLG